GNLDGAEVESNEHAAQSKAGWDKAALEYGAAGRRNLVVEFDADCGIRQIPAARCCADLNVSGKDVVELGCGTAYWSAWLARMGARPVGVDITDAQLENARKFMVEFEPEFTLIQASAEDVPLPDGNFDIAFSEYGASIWCDRYLWIP